MAVHRLNAFENHRVCKLSHCDLVIIYPEFSAVSSSPKLPKESISFSGVCDQRRLLKFMQAKNHFSSVLHSHVFCVITQREQGIIQKITTWSQ